MMLHWLQQTGHKPIALMGGGTTRVGDPSGKDESAQAPDRSRRSRPTRPASSGVFAKFLDFGDGPTDAIMVDNAEWLTQAQLHRVPARRRPAFLGQPHADHSTRVKLRLEREQELSLPRIQLHDPAGLRLRRAGAALRLQCCRWAARTSGATSSTASISAAAWARTQLYRADHAAAHHRLGRQDGQDRRRRGLAQRRPCSAPTTTGSSGATPRTPTSAAS